MSDKKVVNEKELEKEGWIKQSTIGEPRLREIVELYKSLGHEVHLEPMKIDDLDDNCRRCYESEIDEVKTVYIKKKKME